MAGRDDVGNNVTQNENHFWRLRIASPWLHTRGRRLQSFDPKSRVLPPPRRIQEAGTFSKPADKDVSEITLMFQPCEIPGLEPDLNLLSARL